MSRSLWCGFVATIIILSGLSGAYAQSTASISGVVKDSAGGVVPFSGAAPFKVCGVGVVLCTGWVVGVEPFSCWGGGVCVVGGGGVGVGVSTGTGTTGAAEPAAGTGRGAVR